MDNRRWIFVFCLTALVVLSSLGAFAQSRETDLFRFSIYWQQDVNDTNYSINLHPDDQIDFHDLIQLIGDLKTDLPTPTGTPSPTVTPTPTMTLSAAYLQSDLSGVWQSHTLASGPGEPWWSHAELTIAEDGRFSGTLVDSDGEESALSGRLILSEMGVVTLEGDATFHGSLDAGKTTLAMTNTWLHGYQDGTTELMVLTRSGESYSQSDLAGHWHTHSLATGPAAPWWGHADLIVDDTGQFSGGVIDSGGEENALSGRMILSSTGIVIFQDDATFHGGLDAGKTVLALTDTWFDESHDGTTELIVMTRMADSYSQSDLAGVWRAHSLASGPGAPWWSQAELIIDSEGQFTGSLIDSGGDEDSLSGRLILGEDGVVNFDGDPTVHGSLDADKMVLSMTNTWSGGEGDGTAELMVWTKMAVLER